MTHLLRSFVTQQTKIALTVLFCTAAISNALYSEPTKQEPLNLDEIVAQLEKNPKFLDENPELAQRVMEQLMSDPAVVAQMQAEMAQQDKASASVLEDKVKQINFLLKQVLQVIQDLSQIVSNNQLRKINKKEVLANLQQLQRIVADVERGPYLVVNLANVDFLLSFTQMLVAYMRHVIKNGLTNFPEFDPSIIIKRGTQRSLEDIDPTIQQLSKSIQQLKSEERQVGRNWFQQQFKKARSLFDDYKVTNKLLYTGVSAFLIYYFLAQIKMAYFGKTISESHDAENKSLISSNNNSVDPNIFVKAAIYDVSQNNDKLDKATLDAVLKRTKELAPLAQAALQNTSQNSSNNVNKPEKLGWVPELPIISSIYNTVVNGERLNFLMKGLGILIVAGLASTKWEKKLFSMDNITDMMKFQMKTWWQQIKTRCINTANYLCGDPSIKNGHSWLIDPRYTFDDIIGHEAFKQQLNRYVEYIIDPDKFDRAGATPERGILFAGPPQTGKTMLAEATAGEILKRQMLNGNTDKFSFLVFTPQEINESGIDFILWLAEAQAPCIVFIDELDLYGLQRERNTKMLGEFLTAMSGAMNTEKSKRIILLGATNKPENLDQALLQHGRFGKILYFDYPCYEERRQFFNKKLLFDLGLNFSDAFIEKLTRETENCTYNDLKAIVTTALDDAKVQNENITERHLENALDEEVRSIVLQKTKLPESQKRILATHQAGHAMATMLLNETENLMKVTIRSVTKKIQEQALNAEKRDVKEKNKEAVEFGGVFTSPKEDASVFATREQIITQCKILLAGHIAEDVVLGTRSSYHDTDYEKALEKAQELIMNGINKKKLPKDVREQLGQQAYELIQKCEAEVTELLLAHKEEVEAIAAALQREQTLGISDIQKILADCAKANAQAVETAQESQAVIEQPA